MAEQLVTTFSHTNLLLIKHLQILSIYCLSLHGPNRISLMPRNK